MFSKKLITNYLKSAGITVDGSLPYDVRVKNQKFYTKIINCPSLAAGEAYMEGWWECDHLDELFFRICKYQLDRKFYSSMFDFCSSKFAALMNFQTKLRSLRVAEDHYNIGNNLYELMLGKTMAYTCGYWKNAKTLDESQLAKFDLVCRKIGLKRKEKLLELGCGFGTFAKFAAENYGCSVVAVNISKEQVKFGREACKNLPIHFYQCDYRDSHVYNKENDPFDKIVSIGLLEHVGHKNYRHFAEIISNNMKEDGLCLVHSIGKDVTSHHVDPWISKYIFPNSILPSIQLLGKAFEGLFVVEDLHNFSADYDKTLMAWHANFVQNWQKLQLHYDERFYRKWEYYLLSCAGAFRARSLQLWQIVLSPKGILGGYESVR